MKNVAIIDAEMCVGCGKCIDICPASLFTLHNGKAIVSGANCMACGHCEAVCSSAAVVAPILDDDAVDYVTIQNSDAWIPYGEYDTAALVSLMSSRRSCRHFLDTPVDRDKLQDLIKIGVTAPSGTNSQAWTFTVLSERSAVLTLLDGVQRFFKRLNKLARMPLLRLLSRLGNGELNVYYQNQYESVAESLRAWEESSKDSLFFDAPAVILIGSKPDASTPMEDALLAAQNILLGAHAMGLGTCLIGFAVAALKRDSAIQKSIGIPDDEVIHAVIAIGYTDQTFCRTTRRKRVETRFL